jgi:hypothetical protein
MQAAGASTLEDLIQNVRSLFFYPINYPLPLIPIFLSTLKILPSLREPRTLTNSSNLIIRTSTNTPPTLNRWRRIRTPTTDLLKVNLVPITPIRDTFEESVVLGGRHCVDCDVEMPVLAHVVYLSAFNHLSWMEKEGKGRDGKGERWYLRSSALFTMLPTTQAHTSRTFIDDFECQGLGRQYSPR